MAVVEKNEIRLENMDISGQILPALFSNRLILVSHYSAFSSVRRTDAYVRPANGGECRIMRYESEANGE